jgi:5'-methylthioadenosine phosphorylase
LGRLAVIGKQATLGEPGERNPRLGDADLAVFDREHHLVLYRHGLEPYVPPHRIDHAAHARELLALGCDRVLAVSSVGSLRADWPVGTFVLPDDFIALDQPPLAAHDERQHVVPGFTPAWRDRVREAWTHVGDRPLVDGGVYWQANGPRFETPAEIRMIAANADVVGMTVASECVAANQLGLDYAAVCIVDNMANGIADEPLTPEEYARGQVANRDAVIDLVARLVPQLAP